MTSTDKDRTQAVRDAILALIATLPDSALPKWTAKGDTIWFSNLSMGWISSSAPERLAEHEITVLLAAEAASRELLRRSAAVSA